MSFAGKQAIVTGGGSGIGAALCRALDLAGADVVCTDLDADAAERIVSTLSPRARAALLAPAPNPTRGGPGRGVREAPGPIG